MIVEKKKIANNLNEVYSVLSQLDVHKPTRAGLEGSREEFTWFSDANMDYTPIAVNDFHKLHHCKLRP